MFLLTFFFTTMLCFLLASIWLELNEKLLPDEGRQLSLLGGFSSLLYLGVSSFVRISSRFIYFKNKTVSKAKSWYSYSHSIKRLANRSSRTLHRLMNLQNEEAWTWTRNQKTVNKNHVRKCYCCTAKEKHKQTNKNTYSVCLLWFER